MTAASVTLRDARADDHDAVRDLCADIWDDRDGDYLPRVYPEWIEGDDKCTRVAIEDGELVGIIQGVHLSPTESWSQGLRVRADSRGSGIAEALTADIFSWAASQDSLVTRSMVFSWNSAGMGLARSVGFEPVSSFRFAHPEPRSGRLPDTVTRDPSMAWQAWTTSHARSRLAGLALDDQESWALRELRRTDLDEKCALAVVDDGIAAMAVRGRAVQSSSEDRPDYLQEYAASAWRDATAAETLLEAIAIDAGERGATTVRVVVPEHPRIVSDVAMAGVNIADEPHFIFSADLASVSD